MNTLKHPKKVITPDSPAFFKIKYADIKKVAKNYIGTKDAKETSSAVFRIDTFLAFAKHISTLNKSKKVGSIRIYIIRETLKKRRIYRSLNPGEDQSYKQELNRLAFNDSLSQMSFVLVPNEGFENGKDYLNKDKKTILALRPGGEATGLCPPRCPK